MVQPVNGWLLKGVTADVDGDGVITDGGNKTVAVWATNFGGGSVTLQATPDGGTTWITLTVGGTPAVFTANAVRLVDRLGQGMQMRATLTGSTTPVNVNAKIFQ